MQSRIGKKEEKAFADWETNFPIDGHTSSKNLQLHGASSFQTQWGLLEVNTLDSETAGMFFSQFRSLGSPWSKTKQLAFHGVQFLIRGDYLLPLQERIQTDRAVFGAVNLSCEPPKPRITWRWASGHVGERAS